MEPSSLNDICTYVEEHYNSLTIESKVDLMIRVLQHGEITDAVKLRALRILSYLVVEKFPKFYPHLSADQQRYLKQQFLSLFQPETSAKLRIRLCILAADVATYLVALNSKNMMQEVRALVYHCVNELQDPTHSLRKRDLLADLLDDLAILLLEKAYLNLSQTRPAELYQQLVERRHWALKIVRLHFDIMDCVNELEKVVEEFYEDNLDEDEQETDQNV